ncbi:MAG: RICIN domain-containing protein, partial [Abitibacteriaceae bacterium]|nr:RICIN domain-containing protein [Abditibacteriaceae bacterium]
MPIMRNHFILIGVFACALVFGARLEAQEDWGAYSLVPASAPSLVLEAVQAGTNEGTIVSIGKPSGTPNQKWVIVPKGDNFYALRPSYSSTLVLAAANGDTKMGTAIVLETDKSQPWQEWMIKRNENATYTLIPRHSPEKGLDHLGGVPQPGAKIDIWANNPDDAHLQWMIKPLAGTIAPSNSVPTANAPDTTYVPPDIKPESVPRGEIKTLSFKDSAIFPGTVRDVAVFIPAQYDGVKPACVYVKTDGYNPVEKGLLETLIATKEMPVTIGVFVQPGNVPAPVPGTLGRRNRDFEYDGVGDNNVRFLVEELLPFVARQFNLKLSANGNDRCIAGGSSGGIAAFNAAWERPDAFSRVYANSGSFVAFRGGHEFPTLVRKFEAKPIRAYLTTGTHDMENTAGDWFLLDQEMDKALKFSGYDYFFRIINGGHVAGYYDYFREAMSYLWKGWPQPVQAGPGAPRVRDIVLPDEKWQLLAQDRNGVGGATCNASGEVFF